MNTKLKKMYYEMQHKLIMPENRGEDNKALAATVAANLTSIGFPMPTEMIKELAGASKKDIQQFYKDAYTICGEMVGTKFQNAQPFYPGFPESCMSRSDADYFIDQIIYGLSGLTITPALYEEAKDRLPFIGTPMRHVLEAGTEEEFHQMIQQMYASPIAWSAVERDCISEIIKEEGLDNIPAAKNIPNRENLVALACIIEKETGKTDHLKDYLTNPTEIMRYVAVKSAERDFERGHGNITELQNGVANSSQTPSFYRYAALRFADNEAPSMALSRKDRTIVMGLLERAAKNNGDRMAQQMIAHGSLWKKMIKNMHVGDYPQYKETQKAFARVSHQKNPSMRRGIEEAVKSNDAVAAIDAAKRMPGEFARRFDKLLRMAMEQGQTEYAIKALQEIAPKCGINTLLGMTGNLTKRTEQEEARYFKAAKTGKIWKTEDKNRAPIPQYLVTKLTNACYESMIDRYRGKEDMGNVYIGTSMQTCKLPADVRDQGSALGSLTSGSTTPLPEYETERFFVSWTNIQGHGHGYGYRSRVDIDLSVEMLDKNGNLMGHIGWNGAKHGDAFVYSGDVQDGGPIGGPGAAEFIDIDRKAALENGVRYIVPLVNSFTGQQFESMPNTAFGVMQRDKEDFGKLFEPASVMNRFVLDAPCTQIVPMVLDLEKNEILWVNEQAQEQVASRGLSDVFRRVERAGQLTTLPLYPVLMANVEANGHLSSPDKADMLFVTEYEADELREQYPNVDWSEKTFIYPDNIPYITGVLMPDAPKEEPEIDRNEIGEAR